MADPTHIVFFERQDAADPGAAELGVPREKVAVETFEKPADAARRAREILEDTSRRVVLHAGHLLTTSVTGPEGIRRSRIVGGTQETLQQALQLAPRGRAVATAPFRERLEAEGGWPPPLTCRFLGTLCGPTRHELYLVGPDSQPESDGAPQSNFSPPPGEFVGRDEELGAIRARLEDENALVLCGPAGVGKTRAAQQHASASRTRHSSVWWVELASTRDPEEVTAAIAAALGTRFEGSTEQMFDVLRQALEAAGRPLVVLDNVEQLDEAAQMLVCDLVAQTPEVDWLLTSRRSWSSLPQMKLAPLGLADAVGLLEIRASSARVGGFSLRDEDLEHAMRVVRRVDCIPFAIELLASRLAKGEAPASLFEADELLDGEADDAIERTLRRSWELLAAEAQEILRACASFEASFTADAVAHLVDYDDPAAVAAKLDTLVRHAMLITADVPGRYRVLQVVRRFLHRQPAPTHLRERFVRYYAERADAWERDCAGRRDLEGLARLELEISNLRAAAKIAEAEGRTRDAASITALMVQYHWSHGPTPSYLASLDRLIEATRESALHAKLLLARVAMRRRSVDERAADADLAIKVFEEVSDMPFFVRGLQLRANCHLEQDNDLDAAQGLLERADSLAEAHGLETSRTLVQNELARIDQRRGNFPGARSRLLSVLDDASRLGNARGLLSIHLSLALIYTQLEERDESIYHFEAAIPLAQKLKMRGFEAIAESNAGDARLLLGQHDRARTHLLRALRLGRQSGHRSAQILSLATLGELHADLEQYAHSRRWLLQALDAADDLRVLRATIAPWLAAVEAALAHPRAPRTLSEASDLVAECGDERQVAAHDVLRLASDIAAAETTDQLDRLAHELKTRGESSANVHVRFAARVVQRMLDRRYSRTTPPPDSPVLAVADDCAWFRLPDGDVVSLRRRDVLRQLLGALLEHRLERPGECLTVEELVERGWPGEFVLPEAGANRVYVATATLRKLGLRGILISPGEGYMLDPAVAVSVLEHDPFEAPYRNAG